MENVRLLEYLASDEWKGLLNASLLESLCKKQAQRKLNLELPTQGGKLFWETLTVEGWKIQRNKIDGHCRILKPDNTRCAYGSELGQYRTMLQCVGHCTDEARILKFVCA